MNHDSRKHNFYGVTDEPADEDFLAFESQVEGLTEFILQCPTPMTIAIQGGWGSGKSTILKLIDQKLNHVTSESKSLGQTAVTKTIETWPLAHTNAEEDIPAAFVAEVFDRITSDDEKKKENRRRIFNTISPTIRRAFTNFVGSTLGPAGNVASTAINEAFDAMAGGAARADAQRIQSDFEREVKLLLSDGQTKRKNAEPIDRRLVIFVDDLDRLPPARAVQIMETLKLFINSKDCVFVLAIDFDVVVDGTRAIYGDSMSQDKAKMFFHKIIQVPFNVPSPGKQVEGYLEEIRGDWPAGISLTPWALVSMGALDSNPRAVKRVLNAISLLKLIDESQQGDSSQNSGNNGKLAASRDEFFDFCLFTILCIQNADDTLATRLIDDVIDYESYKDYTGTEADEPYLNTDPAGDEDEETLTQPADNVWNEPIGHTRFTPGELMDAHPQSSHIFNVADGSANSRDASREQALKAAAHLCSLTSLKQTPTSKEKPPRPSAGSAEARAHFIEHFGSKQANWQVNIFDEIAAAFDESGLEKEIIFRASSNERLFFSLGPDITLPKGPRSRARKVADLRFHRTGGFTPYINVPGFAYSSPGSLEAYFSASENQALKNSFESLEHLSGKQLEPLSGNLRIREAKNKGIGTDYELAQVHSTDEARRFAVFLVEHMKAILGMRVQPD